jgi:hypothetical protein
VKPEELLTLGFGGLAGFALVDGAFVIAAIAAAFAVLSIWVSTLLIR